ncbi:hypothetical protein ROHU_004349 [Labeo rohita]|uniref:Uncharacterized protein n=1 Tax=Labeo rohita TaxID=84645 RepID=A0A498NMY9_LABRO|nr:hypothetical protein ROHU_004349 [Labeo rohita]
MAETSTQADIEAQISLPSTPRLIMLDSDLSPGVVAICVGVLLVVAAAGCFCKCQDDIKKQDNNDELQVHFTMAGIKQKGMATQSSAVIREILLLFLFEMSSSALNFDYRAESACVYSRTFYRVFSSALNFDYRAESACVYSRTFYRVMGYEVMSWYMRTQYSNCM